MYSIVPTLLRSSKHIVSIVVRPKKECTPIVDGTDLDLLAFRVNFVAIFGAQFVYWCEWKTPASSTATLYPIIFCIACNFVNAHNVHFGCFIWVTANGEQKKLIRICSICAVECAQASEYTAAAAAKRRSLTWSSINWKQAPKIIRSSTSHHNSHKSQVNQQIFSYFFFSLTPRRFFCMDLLLILIWLNFLLGFLSQM